MPGSIQTVYKEPEPWNGDIIDMTWTGYVTIWCFTAPINPYTVKCGIYLPDSEFKRTLPQPLNLNEATGSSTVTSISEVGRYLVTGNCWIELEDGAGGEFFISGGL